MHDQLLLYQRERYATRAQWVIRGCYGPLWTLHRTVPSGFESYVRICQPGWYWQAVNRTKEEAMAVDDYEELKRATPVRWCDIAKENGHEVHRTMKWGTIAPPWVDSRSGQGGFSPPHEGELTLEILDAVFDTLVLHSGEDQECICMFWEGFGNIEWRYAARIEGIGQPGHYLMSASLGSVRDQWRLVLKHALDTSGLTPQAVWPTTENWCFAVPFEMYCSCFGGPQEMALQIQNSSRLETYEVFAGDNLMG